MDPRNADFAKMRIGDTRIDVLGGFQQPVRLVAQLVSGKVISSTTGDVLTLGPQGPGQLSRRDIAQRFLEGKLAPSPSLINDLFKGTDFQGQPFRGSGRWCSGWFRCSPRTRRICMRRPPSGLPSWGAAAGGYGLGAFGIGIQTYAAKPPKSRRVRTDPYGGTTGGGVPDPYTGTSSGSSKDPYAG